MAAGCAEPPRSKAASEGPVVGAAGVLPCLELPTYAAACALLNSRYSCLVAGPHRRHIALDAELLRYSESLLGVPIAYDNIKVVGELGDIYDDQGHIHLNIEADFIIFCPEPGQKLMGTVNKVSSSHIGCLVHGCFNASIPKPEQMPAEQWQTLEVNVGDELEFEVFRLDSDAAGVFCIRGKLNITSLKTKCSAVSEEVTETGTAEEAVDKPPKKKKKKKKDPEPDETEGGTTELAEFAAVTMKEETDLQINNNMNGFREEEPKKKKKKKKKDPEPDEAEGGTTELAEFAAVTMKEETDLQINNNMNGLREEEPKKKKKRKKKDPEPDEAEEGGTTELAEFAAVAMKEETDLQINNNMNGLREEEPKKKKKKQQHQEDHNQDPVFQGSDSSGYQSDHRKKRKHSEEAEFTPLLEHSPKKKRKK
uniref:DNA-directed RNA polymerase subunit n=1 Tax=Molossus molossus TaxID=27622 RepID=A0A7J8HDZ4_MOLMO|nr:hypothetical protein HJG59_019025 [Molossus molossus]